MPVMAAKRKGSDDYGYEDYENDGDGDEDDGECCAVLYNHSAATLLPCAAHMSLTRRSRALMSATPVCLCCPQVRVSSAEVGPMLKTYGPIWADPGQGRPTIWPPEVCGRASAKVAMLGLSFNTG